ncbi:protoporphyrinogen/coproporphyrinogen oxidase [Brevifollis gellanilyticus]|uniref:Oxidoreductase n=1 Tax=Brevifollis gellanilyticus TaxID=748831 RepID=A0A512M2R1_9BACT|nr:NAD(P)/FAD-dependent oxidoreductase [Brevifollis gellanilyticus]GEP41023.1 oxidoreductase [Brevifollis gellanilyticus]
MPSPTIAIVGAGLSGLACARALAKAGRPFTIYEAADGVGGRVRSDKVDGFTLDRGFQVLLPAYPEARRVLDYEGLHLKPLYRGANVYFKNSLHRLADPFHHPLDALMNLRDTFIPWRDKWHTLMLWKEAAGTMGIERRLPEMETEDYLRDFGFTEAMLDRFFRPFFGGVFLEKDLRTSARMFFFLYAMFRNGGATIPAHGIQAIPDQLAVALPPGSLKLNTPVTSVRKNEITLETGEIIRADHIVLAVSEDVAHRLLPDTGVEKPKPGRSTTCLYFSTDQALPSESILYLDGDNRGPVNNACVLTNASPKLAPKGQHLISTSIVGAPSSNELEDVVREQMTRWFGPGARQWKHLRTYQIRNAQPESRQLVLGDSALSTVLEPGLYRCGDYVEDVSINGALISGRKAAEAVLGSMG